MNIPDLAMPLVKEVWRECDPVVACCGPHYKPSMGVPPKMLQIYEAADADWKHARCTEPVQGWAFDGATVSELNPPLYPDFSVRPQGMYWAVGIIEFCIDNKNRRAVYTYSLGPRFARGYKRIFAPDEEIILAPDQRFLLWLS